MSVDITSKYRDSMTQMPSTNWKYFLCLLRTKWNTAMTAITVGAMYSGQISHGWLQHNTTIR